FSSRRRHPRFDCDWSSDVALPIYVGEVACEHPRAGRDNVLILHEAIPRLSGRGPRSRSRHGSPATARAGDGAAGAADRALRCRALRGGGPPRNRSTPGTGLGTRRALLLPLGPGAVLLGTACAL